MQALTADGIRLYVDNEKTFLSGKSAVFKTQRLINDAKELLELDEFLHKTAMTFLSKDYQGGFYHIATTDSRFSLYFSYAKTNARISAHNFDIIFYNLDSVEKIRRNDRSLHSYLNSKGFEILLYNSTPPVDEVDFLKLYRLSHSSIVHFPLLNDEQKIIVTTEDKHVLVQGVAGSGKTNVCIEKIIYSACRGYAGKVLYSTFSRGLLTDTQGRVWQYRKNLEKLLLDYELGKIVFLDDDHKHALENKVGIYFSVDDNDKIFDKIRHIIRFLEKNVDYFLLEDIYKLYTNKSLDVVSEDFFVKQYVKNIKNHQLTGKLQKVSHLSYEILYKEIYGTVLGCCDFNNGGAPLSLTEYCQKRTGSLSKYDCEIIYALAKDYEQYLAQNDLIDNNCICRRLLQKQPQIMYSLAILDEVQDMTELNLFYLKQISRKMFCVGDALQMINPSYFSFAYLKSLLYEKDLSYVAELNNHYRNTKKIAAIIDNLGKINISQFGTHGFVLKGVGVESHEDTNAIYINSARLCEALADEKLNNYTVIVSTNAQKEKLRSILTRQEILTVAEIKGLERETVILYDLLSINADKWKALERAPVNRKQADENSVYRYYFNLFYVGISRAKRNVYVVEQTAIPLFSQFFANEFNAMDSKQAIEHMLSCSDTLEIEQAELVRRVHRFIELEQYDNARFAVAQVQNSSEQAELMLKIEVYQTLVKKGSYREAGLRFWEAGMMEEAKNQFMLDGDELLCSLVDAYLDNDSKNLNVGIISLYPELSQNEMAKKLMLQVLDKDIKMLRQNQNRINSGLQKLTKFSQR